MPAPLQLTIFADYSHFIVQDDAAAIAGGFDGTGWSDDAVQRMLLQIPTAVIVGTARNMTVPVTIELVDAEPAPPADADLVTEGGLEIASGKLVVYGPTDYLPDATRLEVAPGTYAARVHYFGLGTISPDGLDGHDRYHVVLWPAPVRDVRVVVDRRG